MNFTSLRPAVVIALLALLLVAPGFAQTRMFSLHGDSGGDNFGTAVAGLGDLNGDGFADFAVGAPYDLGHGTVRICSGFDGATLATWSGPGSTPGLADNFGYSVGGGGDVNGDGTPDVVVGAPQYSFSPPIGAGYARVLSGANGAVLHTFTGTSPGDFFGFSVDLAGDMNGDGYWDVIVGAATYTTVYSGQTGAPIFSTPYGGSSVARAGDVTGDGYADVVVGSESTSSARIYYGPAGATFQLLTGGAPFGGFGFSVARAGDVNGDGSSEVVVGAPYSGNGLAVVFSGWGVVINSFDGDSPNDRFGWSVGPAGNVDGTGFDEIVVGAPYDANAGSGSGSARVCNVLSGATLFTANGDSANDYFGWSVARAGHVNADNRSDFLVGAYGDGGGFIGSAYVISGAPLAGASATALGGACGAGPGVPVLSLAGSPVLGSSMTIALANAVPSASGLLVADFAAPVPLPLAGGCTAFPNLGNSANWFVLPIATNGAGVWQLPVTLSASHVFAGAPVTMQVAIVPTAGPLGLDLSNGLSLVLGY